MEVNGGLPPIWTVYDSPSDYGPGVFVARKWIGTTPTEEVFVTTSLVEIRELLAVRGLMPLHRSPEDDAKIVESWI